jgi:hypothetical protein
LLVFQNSIDLWLDSKEISLEILKLRTNFNKHKLRHEINGINDQLANKKVEFEFYSEGNGIYKIRKTNRIMPKLDLSLITLDLPVLGTPIEPK